MRNPQRDDRHNALGMHTTLARGIMGACLQPKIPHCRVGRSTRRRCTPPTFLPLPNAIAPSPPPRGWRPRPSSSTLGRDLGHELVAYKRRIGPWLLWRAGPAAKGHARYMALAATDPTTQLHVPAPSLGRRRGTRSRRDPAHPFPCLEGSPARHRARRRVSGWRGFLPGRAYRGHGFASARTCRWQRLRVPLPATPQPATRGARKPWSDKPGSARAWNRCSTRSLRPSSSPRHPGASSSTPRTSSSSSTGSWATSATSASGCNTWWG